MTHTVNLTSCRKFHPYSELVHVLTILLHGSHLLCGSVHCKVTFLLFAPRLCILTTIEVNLTFLHSSCGPSPSLKPIHCIHCVMIFLNLSYGPHHHWYQFNAIHCVDSNLWHGDLFALIGGSPPPLMPIHCLSLHGIKFAAWWTFCTDG